MSYLYTDSSFLENYDSLVESCFDYAVEQEDEILFEEVLLNELSTGLKLRAARKSAEQYMNGKVYNAKRKAEIKEYNKYAPDEYKMSTYEVDYNIDNPYQHAKKRHRLYDFASKHNSYEYGRNDEESENNKRYAEGMQKSIQKINREVKLQRLKDRIGKSWPIQKIKSLLHSLEKLYTRTKYKIESIAPENRNIFQKILAKIFQYIEKLREFIRKRTLKKEVVGAPPDRKTLRDIEHQKKELEDLIRKNSQ